MRKIQSFTQSTKDNTVNISKISEKSQKISPC
jgi:hypothetical protein